MFYIGLKIDFLGCSFICDVMVEFGDGLNFFDLRVDVGLEFVEE